MMALTQQLLATSELWVYGGFLRDAVIWGDVHDAMDLDAGLPKSGNMKAAAGMDIVTKLAAGLGLKFVRNNPTPDCRLSIAYFSAADGSSEFEVQVKLVTLFGAYKATCMAKISTAVCVCVRVHLSEYAAFALV